MRYSQHYIIGRLEGRCLISSVQIFGSYLQHAAHNLSPLWEPVLHGRIQALGCCCQLAVQLRVCRVNLHDSQHQEKQPEDIDWV